jgi:hypothetical protein
MASDATGDLLATIGRRRFGAIDVIRVTPAGRATRRESLFDPAVLARLPRPGIESLGAGPRLIAAVVTRRRSATPR